MKIRKKLIFSIIPFLFLSSCKKQNDLCSHSLSESIIEPTCTEKGYIMAECDSCEYFIIKDEIPALGHQYYRTFKMDENKIPYYELTCSLCSDVKKESFEIDFNKLYGFNDLNRYQNKNSLKELYASIAMVCEDFLNSTADLACEMISINGNNHEAYLIDKIEYKGLNLSSNEALAVLNLIELDNPKYYFLSSTIVYDDTYIYLLCNEEAAYSKNRADINKLLVDMKSYISAYCNTLSDDSAKLKAINDFLIKEIDYAYKDDLKTPQDADWAHSVLGPVMYKKGVCDAYAKAFKLLCDYINIDCLIAEGEAINDLHAWNLAKVNGKWYGIDITYNDTNGSEIYEYYLMNFDKMNSIYKPFSSLSLNPRYLYLLPEISN